jgi:hypothetical protein
VNYDAVLLILNLGSIYINCIFFGETNRRVEVYYSVLSKHVMAVSTAYPNFVGKKALMLL